jgi:hypothetical protein
METRVTEGTEGMQQLSVFSVPLCFKSSTVALDNHCPSSMTFESIQQLRHYSMVTAIARVGEAWPTVLRLHDRS